jgi:hypothetical protein
LDSNDLEVENPRPEDLQMLGVFHGLMIHTGFTSIPEDSFENGKFYLERNENLQRPEMLDPNPEAYTAMLNKHDTEWSHTGCNFCRTKIGLAYWCWQDNQENQRAVCDGCYEHHRLEGGRKLW